MGRRRLAGTVLVALIGAAAWWMLRGDDASSPEPASHPSTSGTPEDPTGATERKSPRTRAARPEAETEASRDVAASAAADEAAAKTYVERVFVVQTTDAQPIAGARVRFGSPILDDPIDDYGIHRTDAAGRVRLTVMFEGDLFVRADGFASRVVHLSRNRTTSGVIEMRRPQAIAGIVVDAAGRPVSGAVVTAKREVLRPVETRGDGGFAFDDVDPGDWDLRLDVACEGFATWYAFVRPGDGDVRVQLSRPCSIAGRVVLPDGRPVADAEFDETVTIEDDGSFRIDDLAAGDALVSVEADVGDAKYVGEIVARLADGETLRDVRVELRPAARSFVVARIVGPGGAAVSFSGAQALHDAGGVVAGGGDLAVVPAGAPVGAMELVTFRGVRDGDVDYGIVVLRFSTRAAAAGAPDVVTLPRLEAFAVEVVDSDGRPNADERVDARVIPNASSIAATSTRGKADGPGRFRFRIAVGAAHRVVVRLDGVTRVSRGITDEELAAGRAVVRLTAGATVRVRIVAAPPGRVAKPAFALRTDVRGLQAMVPKGGVSPDGRYAIEHVPPGKWEAQIVSCGSIVEKTLTIDVPESGELDLGDVVVPGTTTLRGRVVTADGRPAGGAVLEYFDERRLTETDGVRALTRTDGTFDLDVSVGATGDLSVEKAGHGGVIVPLDGTSAPLEVRLGAACALRVTLRRASDRVPYGSVAVTRPGGTALWTPECEYVEHPRDGSTTLVYRGLAAGKWVVRVHDAPPIDRAVTLVAGETVEVVVDGPK